MFWKRRALMRKNSLTCANCWKGASDRAMTAAMDLNAIAQTSAVQIVDCLVEGTLIAIFAGLVLKVTRRQNSDTRFAVWFSALMAIAILPFFETWMQANISSPEVYMLFKAAVNAIWGGEPRDLSLLYALWYARVAGNERTPGSFLRLISTGGGAQESRFVGGSQLLSIRMAAKLGKRVLVGSPVRTIAQDQHGVTVESERMTVRASRAIVTILPALTAAIDFTPPLPGLRAQLIQRMPH